MNRHIRPLGRLAAVVAPMLGLAALWGMSHETYQQGTEWEVPIQGYDPRDYLRGHYVEFTYDWPGLGEAASFRERLCLEGVAPRVDRVFTPAADAAICPHPLKATTSSVYGISALMNGRLYIGQDRAAALEQQLRNRDQRGIVTIRQREDGSFTPISIRFRPLPPAEIAERDAPQPAPLSPFDPLAPPAIMDK